MRIIAFHDFVEKLNLLGISIAGWRIRSRKLKVEYEILSIVTDEGCMLPFVKTVRGSARGALRAQPWKEIIKIHLRADRSKKNPFSRHYIVITCS